MNCSAIELRLRFSYPMPWLEVALVFRAGETLAPFLGTFSGLPPGTLPARALGESIPEGSPEKRVPRQGMG